MYAPLDLRFVAMVDFRRQSIYSLVALQRTAYNLSNSVSRGSSGVQLGQFAHDFAAALVLQMRHDDLDGHDLIAALAGMRRAFDAALAHAQFLPALRAGRNLQLRAAVDGGHFHLGAERGFGTVTGTVMAEYRRRRA